MCHKRPLIFSTCHKHFPVLSSFMTYHSFTVTFGAKYLTGLVTSEWHIYYILKYNKIGGWKYDFFFLVVFGNCFNSDTLLLCHPYNMCHKRPLIFSTCHKHFPVLSSFMTYHRVSNKSKTTGTTSGAFLNWTPDFATGLLYNVSIFSQYLVSQLLLEQNIWQAWSLVFLPAKLLVLLKIIFFISLKPKKISSNFWGMWHTVS
jgi:hypothetical protein